MKELGRQAALKQQAQRREEIEASKPRPLLPKAEKESDRVKEIVPEPSRLKPTLQVRDQAARIVGSNPRYIQDAKTVKEKAPELHEKVKAGVITLPQAKREVARIEKRAELEAKAAAVESKAPTEPSWKIVEGDCLEVLPTIEAGSVRLIFADPPYNIGIDYGDHHDDAMDSDDFMEWCESWMRLCVDRLAPDGSMWVLINDEWADVFGCLLRDVGLHRRAWIKWYESFGVNNANNFNRTSRHLFYMVKDAKRFVFNADAVNRPSDRQAKYGDSRAALGGKVWDAD